MNKPTIPTTWTPEQAWSVYEWLHELAEQVWTAAYDQQLIEVLQRRVTSDEDDQHALPF